MQPPSRRLIDRTCAHLREFHGPAASTNEWGGCRGVHRGVIGVSQGVVWDRFGSGEGLGVGTGVIPWPPRCLDPLDHGFI